MMLTWPRISSDLNPMEHSKRIRHHFLIFGGASAGTLTSPENKGPRFSTATVICGSEPF